MTVCAFCVLSKARWPPHSYQNGTRLAQSWKGACVPIVHALVVFRLGNAHPVRGLLALLRVILYQRHSLLKHDISRHLLLLLPFHLFIVQMQLL